MGALTGLTPDEFRALVPTFTQEWEEHTRLNWMGEPRRRAAGAGPKSELERPELKLFFILFYLRQYPIQEVMDFYFGFSRGAGQPVDYAPGAAVANDAGAPPGHARAPHQGPG